MKVAIFSDLHLGTSGDSEEWHQIALEWVESFTDYLEENKIDTVFFLGDWFNNKVSVTSTTSSISSRIYDKLKKFKLYIFPGNHDLFYQTKTDISSIEYFRHFQNVEYIEEPTDITISGKTIRLCPWGYNPIEIEGDTDYLFGHFEINTFQMNSSEHLCEDGFKLSDLLRKYKAIYSGHFHKAQKRVYSSGTIQYVGNPFQKDFGESGDDKGFWILDLETNDAVMIKNDISPKFTKISLSRLITLDIKEIPGLLKNNFVRLSVDKNITENDLDVLTELIGFCKPRNLEIDWADRGFSQNVGESNSFATMEFLPSLINYIKMLDIEDHKWMINYITEIYKKVSEV